MENFHNVLVPTDFSTSSWQAVLAGIKVANPNKAKVSILHVTEFRGEQYLEMISNKLNNLCSNLSSIYDLTIESVLMHGSLETAVPELIKEKQIDIVVVGLDDHKIPNISQLSTIIQSLNVPVVMVPGDISQEVVNRTTNTPLN